MSFFRTLFIRIAKDYIKKMKIKRDDIIYTAGFFDGEGYIGIGWEGRKEVRIINSNKEVIEYLKNLWGGLIYKRKVKTNHTQVYDLVIFRKSDVNNFAKSVFPFVKVKKETIGQLYTKEELEIIK